MSQNFDSVMKEAFFLFSDHPEISEYREERVGRAETVHLQEEGVGFGLCPAEQWERSSLGSGRKDSLPLRKVEPGTGIRPGHERDRGANLLRLCHRPKVSKSVLHNKAKLNSQPIVRNNYHSAFVESRL